MFPSNDYCFSFNGFIQRYIEQCSLQCLLILVKYLPKNCEIPRYFGFLLLGNLLLWQIFTSIDGWFEIDSKIFIDIYIVIGTLSTRFIERNKIIKYRKYQTNLILTTFAEFDNLLLKNWRFILLYYRKSVNGLMCYENYSL